MKETIQKIDIGRCWRAMQQLDVRGDPNPTRHYLLEEAMALIQTNGTTALSREYLGIKNYAHFGDQRADHEYNCCPRHGYIVFSIERKNLSCETPLGTDHVYLLECVRDFGYKEMFHRASTEYNAKLAYGNLCDFIRRYMLLKDEMSKLEIVLTNINAIIHE